MDVWAGGPGIGAADRERTLEPVYRAPGASESTGGVGPGLSLVRQIVWLHGGSVRREDDEGSGCRFRVTLPGR